MVTIITSLSRISLLIMISLYGLDCFVPVIPGCPYKIKTGATAFQAILTFFILINASIVIYFNKNDEGIIYLLFGQLIVFAISSYVLTNIVNPASMSLLNNMFILISLGFIMLERLDMNRAARQFMFVVFSLFVSGVILYILKKFTKIKDLKYLYCTIGIILLLLVSLCGTTEYGAKLSLSIAGISIQPSEFVKITFVFFLASILYKDSSLKTVLITTILAACHVLIMVASKDLGGALILLICYIFVLYVATRNIIYLLITSIGTAIAGFLAVKIFPHIQTRFIAWSDPLSDIDNKGYQICQSLFAIGTGSWLGSGLTRGMPNKIPVVAKDFIFAAISEEFGAFFGLFVIIIYISCFLQIFIIALNTKDKFYKLIALGFGVIFSVQTFLNIGGVIKFIPSTGVTLPFISYGGSSILSTMIIFTILQATYTLSGEEGKYDNTNKKSKRSNNNNNRRPTTRPNQRNNKREKVQVQEF